MDARADTLSGRFGGQWAFLSTPPRHTQARSLPPSSSYLRTDRSNVSPLPTALHFHQLNASRSSLPRNAQTSSVGGHSSTTIPSQPILVRAHSAHASIQIYPPTLPPRLPRRRNKDVVMDPKPDGLPPIQEYSFRSILASIDEEIADDVNAISEIFGRSRLVLADQHDSHLPPQGEIRATSGPLQAVAEASSSNERLAATDDVIILREDASLVDGSHTGSAAYGLLERLQAVPRTRRMRSEIPVRPMSRPGTSSIRNYPAPAMLPEPPAPIEDYERVTAPGLSQASRRLLRHQIPEQEVGQTLSRATHAVVSEIYLSAGANAVTVSDPPVVSESGRHYPLYSFDDSSLFEGPIPAEPPSRLSFRERLQSLLPRTEFQNFTSWVYGRGPRVVNAESQLRDILNRQHRTRERPSHMDDSREDTEMYE